MDVQELALDAREIVRRFRRTHTNYHTRWPNRDAVPEGVTFGTPSEHPLDEDRLPAALRAELRAYKKAHPHHAITFLKHMRTVDGRPELVIEDRGELPSDAQLLILSQTVTLAACDSVRIVTDLFVARTE